MTHSTTIQDMPSPILYGIAEFLDANSLRALSQIKELNAETSPFIWRMIVKRADEEDRLRRRKKIWVDIFGEIYTMTRDGMLEMTDDDEYGLKPIGRSAYYEDVRLAFFEFLENIKYYLLDKHAGEEMEYKRTGTKPYRYRTYPEATVHSPQSDESTDESTESTSEY